MTTLERGSNRLIRLAPRAGVAPRAFALLETTGRCTGLARHTPATNGLDGDTFWLAAAHGTQADYVRNMQASPRVRVKVGGAWRAGTAVVLPDDDALARSRTLPCQWDATVGHSRRSRWSARVQHIGPAFPVPQRYGACRRVSRPAPGVVRPGWL